MKKIVLLSCIILPYGIFAQMPDSMSGPPAGGNPSPFSDIPAYVPAMSLWQNPELISSLIILLVGIILLGFIIFGKATRQLPSEQYVNLIVVVLSIVAALYLIAAGWNSEQTAPAFGLLGAIVGYILGKSHDSTKKNENSPGSST